MGPRGQARTLVVAKGVETEAQLAFLMRENCDGVQGYYFCRPLPADAFAGWWSEYRRKSGAITSPNTPIGVA